MINPAIYVIQDPETLEIRYVGLSTNFPKRFQEHINCIHRKHKCHTPLYKWLKSLKRLPVFTIVQCFRYGISVSDLNKAEIYWIQYFKEHGCKLLNQTSGGRLLNPTVEVRRKISESAIKRYKENPNSNPFKGKIRATRKPFYDHYGRCWNHTREASAALGIDRSSICRVLKQKKKSAGGVIFTYNLNDPIFKMLIKSIV